MIAGFSSCMYTHETSKKAKCVEYLEISCPGIYSCTNKGIRRPRDRNQFQTWFYNYRHISKGSEVQCHWTSIPFLLLKFAGSLSHQRGLYTHLLPSRLTDGGPLVTRETHRRHPPDNKPIPYGIPVTLEDYLKCQPRENGGWELPPQSSHPPNSFGQVWGSGLGANRKSGCII